MGSGSQAPGTLPEPVKTAIRTKQGVGLLIQHGLPAYVSCSPFQILHRLVSHTPGRITFQGGRPDFDDSLSTIRLRDESKRCFIALFNETKQ